MDNTFKRFAISQVKLFLFSEHNTTSSMMCYVLYLLSIHPWALERVRDEHTKLLGFDAAQRIKRLSEDSFLLNRLPYTLAVIKETMRLYPVVSSTRGGEPEFYVKYDEGRLHPTERFMVWSDSQYIRRDPAYWPQPDDFLPDRWLVPAGDPLYPVKGGYRPFEFRPS